MCVCVCVSSLEERQKILLGVRTYVLLTVFPSRFLKSIFFHLQKNNTKIAEKITGFLVNCANLSFISVWGGGDFLEYPFEESVSYPSRSRRIERMTPNRLWSDSKFRKIRNSVGHTTLLLLCFLLYSGPKKKPTRSAITISFLSSVVRTLDKTFPNLITWLLSRRRFVRSPVAWFASPIFGAKKGVHSMLGVCRR